MKKKWISLLLLMVAIGAYVGFFIKNQEKKAQMIYENAEQSLLDKLTKQYPNTTLKQEKKNTYEIIQLIPKDNDGQPVDIFSEKLNDFTKDITLSDDKPEKHIFFITEETLHPKVEKITYHYQSFEWSKHQQTWDEKENKILLTDVLASDTHSKLTLGQLFSNQENLLVLSNLIQEELVKKAESQEKNIDSILYLPILKENDTNFTYASDHVTLNLPENDLNITEYKVDYSDVGHLLNSDFVDQSYIREPVVSNYPNPNEKMIALTFDDGPNNSSTLSVLKALSDSQVPATFFMLGSQAKQFPNIVKQIANEGHELANHSYSHPDLTSLPEEKIREEINETQLAIYNASGVLPKYVRPPYGSVNYQTAVAIGKPIINWSIDSLDWKTKDKKKIIKDIKETVHNQGIILMHDIHEESAASLPEVISELKNQGYQFKTISDLLSESPAPLTVHYSSLDARSLSSS